MKSILHISNYYYPHVGGIETTCRDIVGVLKKTKNYKQKIICFGDGPTIVDEIDVIRVPYLFVLRSQPIYLHYKKLLKNVIKEFQPDIILIHAPNPLVEKALLGIDFLGKLIVYHHTDIYRQKILKKIVKPVQKKLYRRADLILCHSEVYVNQSDELKEFKNKCKILPLCYKESDFILNDEDLKEVKRIRQHYKNKKIVFLSGRHTVTKGIDYAIKACEGNDDIVFILGRTGKPNRKFDKLIIKAKNVVYLGLVNKRLYSLFLNACDIFLFPSISKNEAFPITLIEAISLGKPAITFKVEGSAISYISPNNVCGLENPNRDIKALKESINKLVHDNDLRYKLGQTGIDRASKLFNYRNFFTNVKDLIENI